LSAQVIVTLAGLFVLTLTLHAVEAVDASSLYGKPEVMKFKGGRPAAFCMQFDDSMDCQADFAIPELNKRGLVGTFFINPGLDRYQRHREVWEVVCPKHGHELADHTMHHQGAKDEAEADYEIGECARYIWRLYPEKSRLRPFLSGGGTTWNVSREKRGELADKYFLFSGFTGPGRVSCADDRGTGPAIVYAQKALEEGAWAQVGFHGVGDGWIVTSREHFLELVDYLAANRDRIWVATTGEVFKYTQERDAVTSVSVSDATEDAFKVSVECAETKVKSYGQPFTALYDEALTVRVRVPAAWARFRVSQGSGGAVTADAIEVDGGRYARFDVRPNMGSALVALVEPTR